MKKPKHRQEGPAAGRPEEILPEYDFGEARPNKYAALYTRGSRMVTLDPDVAAEFPTAAQANDALRALAGIIRSHRAE